MAEFVVITGLSGAGRSSAADNLEDLGWFVIDNLPAPLISKVVELASTPGSAIERVALVAGTGSNQVDASIASLRESGLRVRTVFLDASTDALVRRYESTRRRHPQSNGESLAETIEHERSMLERIRADADVLIDTSDLNVHELRSRLVDLFGSDSQDQAMVTTLLSFGYKHGLPRDVDLILDGRFLPNPHWVPELRPLSGLDAPVRDYVLTQDAAEPFLERLGSLLDLLLPAYVEEGKAYLTIAFGCTGGRHRSVAIAEEVARRLGERGSPPTVTHRDLDR
jgi:UPF0042 nucleotide-binding protein